MGTIDGGARGSGREPGSPFQRREVDLELALKDPARARKYIAEFDWGPVLPPRYIVLGIEEKIWFHSMSDAEAVLAAQTILRDIDLPNSWRERQLVLWDH